MKPIHTLTAEDFGDKVANRDGLELWLRSLGIQKVLSYTLGAGILLTLVMLEFTQSLAGPGVLIIVMLGLLAWLLYAMGQSRQLRIAAGITPDVLKSARKGELRRPASPSRLRPAVNIAQPLSLTANEFIQGDVVGIVGGAHRTFRAGQTLGTGIPARGCIVGASGQATPAGSG